MHRSRLGGELTSFSQDALTASLIMTTRQFLSIILNAGAFSTLCELIRAITDKASYAGIFGNFRTVGLVGWMGVAWVASGIYIKMMIGPPRTPQIEHPRAPKVGEIGRAHV